MIPEVLKNFNVFVDGRGFAGVAEEVTPPKLALKMEEHRAGGLDAPIDIEMGMEKLTLEFTLAQYDKNVLKLWGLTAGSVVPLTLRGALEAGDGTVTAVVVNLRGQIVEIDEGTWKAGEKSQMKCTVSCRYYKRTQGGEVLHEIDVENMVRIVGGVDQLAALRGTIGV